MSEICKAWCLRAWLSWNYYFLFQYLNVPRQKCLKWLHANVSIIKLSVRVFSPHGAGVSGAAGLA